MMLSISARRNRCEARDSPAAERSFHNSDALGYHCGAYLELAVPRAHGGYEVPGRAQEAGPEYVAAIN